VNACRNKALFLDRDGVINVERGYVHNRESFDFIPDIFELCQAAQNAGYLLIVVTNQAGIARGYYSEADFSALTDWMMDRFSEQSIKIAGVYYCPYHPVFGVGKYRRDSPDRKPNPGMLLRAKSEWNLDMASSILIGDKDSDMQAGSAAGVGTLIFLSTELSNVEPRETPYYVSPSLDDIRLTFFSSGNSVGQKHEAEQFHKVL
jgi:D-glycero-D-manno-heptose 1,7-bisphosphate phosphatase